MTGRQGRLRTVGKKRSAGVRSEVPSGIGVDGGWRGPNGLAAVPRAARLRQHRARPRLPRPPGTPSPARRSACAGPGPFPYRRPPSPRRPLTMWPLSSRTTRRSGPTRPRRAPLRLAVERLEERLVPDGSFGPWGTPVNLGAAVNTAFSDHRPTISKDGLSLYFGSNRPG